jgi:adenylate cyclase class IV
MIDLKITGISINDILNSIWWQWCNALITIDDVRKIANFLEIELDFITFRGYKFSNKEKTIIYERRRQ